MIPTNNPHHPYGDVMPLALNKGHIWPAHTCSHVGSEQARWQQKMRMDLIFCVSCRTTSRVGSVPLLHCVNRP
jgi:hypothetical protein